MPRRYQGPSAPARFPDEEMTDGSLVPQMCRPRCPQGQRGGLRDAYAAHHAVLVDIEAGTFGVQDFHRSSPRRETAPAWSLRRRNLDYVVRDHRSVADSLGCSRSSGFNWSSGSNGTMERPTSVPAQPYAT